MKLLDLKEQLLNEINMSPNSLRREAKSIGALAGMEFEMYVPDFNLEDADDGGDDEPDYDQDESVRGIQDAYDFFNDGDYNSRRDVQNMRERMQNDYQEWTTEQFGSRWDGDQDTFIYNYLKENASNDEIAEILGREDDSEDVKDNYGRKEVAEAVDKIMEEGSGKDWYDQAYEAAYEDYMGDDNEMEWLEDQGLNAMSDISNAYNMTWPHWINSSQGDNGELDDLGDEFSRMINKPVNVSNDYHGADREPGHYVIEPDGSLKKPKSINDKGMEFVSPPLPIDEIIQDLKKIKAWAVNKGCYTNSTTGLHINVSVPNWTGDLAKLDFVKLAILVGDEYVLKEFGRTGNTYANSALKIVKDHIKQQPNDAALLLSKMKEHLNASAAKLIHSGATSKFTSINTKEGYIEFRSPGDDWLKANYDKIESTLLRFVVAMDAAVDETKYKEEYAKKLYKLLNPEGLTDEYGDMIQEFSKYMVMLQGDQKEVSGKLSKEAQQAIKDFRTAATTQLKQNRLDRDIASGNAPAGQQYWWNVQWDANRRIEVVASNKKVARQVAAEEWDVPEEQLAIAKVTMLRPYEAQPAAQQQSAQQGNWGIWIDSNGRFARQPNTVVADNVLRRFPSQAAAMAFLERSREARPDMRTDVEVREIEPSRPVPGSTVDLQRQRAAQQTATRPIDYQVYDRNTGATVYAFTAADDDAAMQGGLEDYRTMGPHSLTPQQAAQRYSLRRAGAAQASQTSTRPGQGQERFTGEWKIVDANDREIYRFGGVGNAQSDANRIAMNWLRQNPQHMQSGVQVLPVMG